jgi:hypothetical protein
MQNRRCAQREIDCYREVLVLYLERPLADLSKFHRFFGRFGYSGLKEAAGVCGGCGQAMGIESTFACNMLM